MLNSNLGTHVSTLTPLQTQRYDYLFPIYGKAAADIVKNIYGKGRNSWASFLEKMGSIEEAKPHVKEYYNALYETFKLYEPVTPGQVIGNVNSARREMGLVPYTEKIKIQSEYDFNLIFVVDDHYLETEINGVPTKVFQGYIPVAKVKPE